MRGLLFENQIVDIIVEMICKKNHDYNNANEICNCIWNEQRHLNHLIANFRESERLS